MRAQRIAQLTLLVLAAACVRNVDLTPSAPGEGKAKPDAVPPVISCGLDGGVCPQLSSTCVREKLPCAEPSACCSGRCEIKASATGACKLLPSCHVSYEACALGTDCCSGVCILLEDASGRCEPASGCASVGERCAASSLCCSGLCRETPEGVLRCGGGKCKELGETCTKSDECCDKDPSSCREGSQAGLRCLGPAGLLATCLVDGEACLVPEQCCSGGCLALSTGLLRCGAGDPLTSPQPIP